MTNLLYFNKLIQIPSIILHETCGTRYRDIFALFCDADPAQYPILAQVNEFFETTARDIQDGKQEEFVHSKEWLDIWWPPEEYAFIKLCKENKLDAFYSEASTLMKSLVDSEQSDQMLGDALMLNKALIKLPFQNEDMEIELSYNIWEIYRAVLIGNHVQPRLGEYHHIVDRTTERWPTWDDWYQKMVWWGNRRGAYLYGNKLAGTEIAGHH